MLCDNRHITVRPARWLRDDELREAMPVLLHAEHA